ncbi:hypothetical protein LCGC14_0236330 [marine sediment metagenome]|uniref:Uncharacterized protein n=1 Tax=marine sediment metagenome TaxID=412755 RepID=A0A0F9U9B9_9ZZZZ
MAKKKLSPERLRRFGGTPDEIVFVRPKRKKRGKKLEGKAKQ